MLLVMANQNFAKQLDLMEINSNVSHCLKSQTNKKQGDSSSFYSYFFFLYFI